MCAAGPLWYAAYTNPRAEARAAQRLRAQDYAVFMPTLRKTVRHARRSRTIETPLFPRYLFVSLDLTRDRWRSINGTAGVSGLVSANDRPLPLATGLVEALIAAEAIGAHAVDDDAFHIDDPACFRDGPFAELIGHIRSIDAKGRVELLLQLMGRSVAVQTTVAQLRPLPA